MSSSIPSASTFLQLTSSSSGLNSLCTCTDSARPSSAVPARARPSRATSADIRAPPYPAGRSLPCVRAADPSRTVSLNAHFPTCRADAPRCRRKVRRFEPHRLPDRVFRIEDRPEAEREAPLRSGKTLAHHPSVLQHRLFVEFGASTVIFADNHREFPARIASSPGLS